MRPGMGTAYEPGRPGADGMSRWAALSPITPGQKQAGQPIVVRG
jgi:hypothetical protein